MTTRERQFTTGYRDALADLLTAYADGGFDKLAGWIVDNCRAEDRERAERLRADLAGKGEA